MRGVQGYWARLILSLFLLGYVYKKLRNPAQVSAVSSAMINSVVTVVVLLALPAVIRVIDHLGRNIVLPYQF